MVIPYILFFVFLFFFFFFNDTATTEIYTLSLHDALPIGLRGRLPAADLVAMRADELVGFLLGRDGRLAAHLGPLIAEDDAITRALVARALEGIDGPLFVDLADSKTELRRFLDAHGFAAVRPFTRMLYGAAARFDDPARTFAVLGPEFG